MFRCMHRTNIYLEDRQTAALDRLAREQGASRAEVIRRILDRALDSEPDSRAADQAAIDLSFGSLVDVEVDLPSRAPDERAAHLAAVWGASS